MSQKTRKKNKNGRKKGNILHTMISGYREKNSLIRHAPSRAVEAPVANPYQSINNRPGGSTLLFFKNYANII